MFLSFKVEQLSLAEHIRLYKMIGEKVKCKTRKNKIKSHQAITDEEAIAFNKRVCFSREVFVLRVELVSQMSANTSTFLFQ
jgi:hypothetical protein